jgi:O-acetyl-ADP-ribose deacetylase (regulator of RNase III)
MYKHYIVVSIFMVLLLLEYSVSCNDKIKYKYFNTEIILDYGTIEKQTFTQSKSAIVNAANKWLQGGGGIDGAIHQAASGQKVHNSETCFLCVYARTHFSKKNNQYESGREVLCPVGEAKITPAFNIINTSNIIHAVGPQISSGETVTKIKEDALIGAYKNSFECAKKNGIQAIAFPQISVGIFHYPLDNAALVALRTTLQFIKDNPKALQEVRFIMWKNDKVGQDGYILYKNTLNNLSTIDKGTNTRIIAISNPDQLNLASADSEQSKISARIHKIENRWSTFANWFLRLIRWRTTSSPAM